ncbi:MAG: hypothetical protein KC561_13640, partial [Myxococcales bacterium]|nr:hypothetical protein [Myxococcales bacterium]
DPVARVRLRSLLLLSSDYPRSDAHRRALEAARTDSDGEVRVAAADLCEDGLDQLCREALEQSNSTDARCAAIEAVSRRIETLDDPKHRHLFDSTAEELAEANAPRLDAAAHNVLRLADSSSTDTALVPPLLAALTRSDLKTSTQLVVARAIGQVGDVSVVKDLLAYSQERQRTVELRNMARAAITQIQARAGGAGEGQLALTEVQAREGALRFPHVQEGDMSLDGLTRTASPSSKGDAGARPIESEEVGPEEVLPGAIEEA